MRTRTLCLAFAVALAAGAFACRQEGAAEKAGGKIDQAAESVQMGGGGAFEAVGRKADDAADDAKDDADDQQDDAPSDE